MSPRKAKGSAQSSPIETPNGDAYFVGGYVRTLTDALVSSAIAGESAIVLSPPGMGKTDIAVSIARDIAPGQSVFSRLSPSTPPEKITGMPDPAKALGNPPVIEYVVKDTPYDPNARIIVLDEFGRTNDIVFDLLLDVLDRQDIDPDTAPTIWATSNFAPTSDRTEALRDRFALWVWMDMETIDIPGTVNAHMTRKAGHRLRVPNHADLPKLADIEKIKGQRGSKDTIEVISRAIQTLAAEAINHGFKPNYRRITQWQSILYRTGVFYSGDPQFTQIPNQAISALRWAWPTSSREEAVKWGQVVSAIADIVGTAIESLMSAAYQKFKEIKDSNVRDRVRMVQMMGEELANVQNSLERVAPGDPRIEQAIEELSRVFGVAAVDGDPFG